MSRTIPAALLTALSEATVEPFFAVEMLFDSGALRLWTGYGDRQIDGEAYVGGGELMTIGGLEETSGLAAHPAQITLSGVPSSIISLALSEPYQGRKCRVLFGARPVADFVEVFSGLMDKMSIIDEAEHCSITLTVESKLVELERPRLLRYTQESQESLHPGDTFFSFVTDIQDKEVVWGRSSD
jgi:hypothetical protein